MRLEELASAAAEGFAAPGGSVALREDAPQWVRDVVREVLGPRQDARPLARVVVALHHIAIGLAADDCMPPELVSKSTLLRAASACRAVEPNDGEAHTVVLSVLEEWMACAVYAAVRAALEARAAE